MIVPVGLECVRFWFGLGSSTFVDSWDLRIALLMAPLSCILLWMAITSVRNAVARTKGNRGLFPPGTIYKSRLIAYLMVLQSMIPLYFELCAGNRWAWPARILWL